MNKNMYITEKIFRFLSLSIVGIAFNIAISYAVNISREITPTNLKDNKIKTVQTISMKIDNLVELDF